VCFKEIVEEAFLGRWDFVNIEDNIISVFKALNLNKFRMGNQGNLALRAGVIILFH